MNQERRALQLALIYLDPQEGMSRKRDELESLTCLLTWIFLVDNIDATAATHNDTVFFQCFNRRTYFHGVTFKFRSVRRLLKRLPCVNYFSK